MALTAYTMSPVCTLLLLAASVYLITADTPCPYEVCTCHWRIDCTRKGLIELPPLKNGTFPQTSLDISYNQIKNIRRGHLPPGLKSFTSFNNPILWIANHAFDGSATTLESISFTNSSVRHIPHILTALKTVTFADHNITDSTQISLPNSVQDLALYSNCLTEVPITVSSLHKLTRLDLQKNDIQSVDSFVFPSSLEKIFLNENNIEIITSISVLNNSTALWYLNLYNNPLKHIAKDAFSQIPALTYIYLDSTQLTRLPLALHSLTHLSSLHLNDIPTLVCTCQESTLVPWYNNMTSMKLYGDCDGHTIDYFLGTLAKNCPPPTLSLLLSTLIEFP